MRITVIGTGYVGLVTAACLAELGHRVTGVDVDQAKIESLARGEVSILEPGLSELVTHHLHHGRLAFTTDMTWACAGVDAVFIAVGTPTVGPGFAELGYVLSAARAIGEHLDGPATVVVKSTVPPGTAGRVRDTVWATMALRGVSYRIDVASNPEFLREGSAVQDFLAPDRVVIGAAEPSAMACMQDIYAPLLARGHRLLKMDLVSAEMAKYAANAMLAVRISAVNELASIAEACGADFEEVRSVLASDHRIGENFLAAGAGYGGSCFPKDMRALARLAHEAGVETPLIDATESVNLRARESIYEKIERWAERRGGLSRCTVALWGLSFKPGTDDVREAPALTVLRMLLDAGSRVRAHDPAALNAARRVIGDPPRLTWSTSPQEALRGADALVLLTEWPEYREFSAECVAQCLADRVVFDGRNALDVRAYRECGITVVGVGRPLPRDLLVRRREARDAAADQPRAVG
ncbi:MAG: ugd [Burkholderiaceae bacterium]|jgi:UDPglucose 6-dehydrogenase|nr:ugd [Burkholderiaceae bacterium]